MNGKSVLRFDGTDDKMLINNSITIGSAFIVLNWSGSGSTFPNYKGIITAQQHIAPDDVFIGEIYTSNIWNTNGIFYGKLLEINSIETNNLSPLDTFKILVGTTNTPTGFTNLQIGDVWELTDMKWNGDFVEILIYDKELSLVERRQVEFYLSQKYAISISNASIVNPKSLLNFKKYIYPSDVSGLQLWFKQDVVVLNGNTVSQWSDMSGNGNHAVQNNATYQPLYVRNSGSKNTLRFDGNDDYLESTFTSAISHPNTKFVVFKKYTPDSGRLDRVVIDGPSYNNRSYYYYAGGQEFDLGDSTGVLAHNTSRYNDLNIHTLISNTMNSKIYLNGSIASSGNAGSNVTTGMIISNSYFRTSEYAAKTDFYEIIMYNRLLSEIERQSIEIYLSAKYAITIAYSYTLSNVIFNSLIY